LSSAYERWRAGLSEEVTFWEGVVRTGGDWPEDIKARLDPETPFQQELRMLIREPGPIVQVLDVGAGPMTILGKKWEGREVVITAIDALASEYAMALGAYSVHPPVTTTSGVAESLSMLFKDGFFDLAYARNSLDHSYDPCKAILGMLHVVKHGAPVVLEHSQRESEKQRGRGLHQWDFDVVEGKFVIDREGVRQNISEMLEEAVDVDACVSKGWVYVILRKK
jgi:ubiquinone/menaquinone biosynthesis C-methylase UbiE